MSFINLINKNSLSGGVYNLLRKKLKQEGYRLLVNYYLILSTNTIGLWNKLKQALRILLM